MDCSITSDNLVTINSSHITLRGLVPVLNGSTLQNAKTQVVKNDPQHIVLQFHAPSLGGGSFGLEIANQDQARCWLRYWMAYGTDEPPLDSFGIQFQEITNLRAYLRNGYQSWDGSQFVEPEAMRDWEEYEERPETGCAMTLLVPRIGDGGMVLGFDRHDRYQQMFKFDTRKTPAALTIQTLWDRKNHARDEPCESERLYILEHEDIEEGLREWARLVVKMAPRKPRALSRIRGWCSWYNLYGYITEDNILEHLSGIQETVRQHHLPMRVFQIDDGFTPEMGDWLEVKPQFPRGMKPLLDDIRSAGFIPGLWIAPFMVGNRSHLFREHPDWVIRDRESGGPLVQRRFYGEFRWHKRSEEYYILDATHPAAFDYIQRVFRTWRNDWGCEYFKLDFMYFGSEYGPDRALYHTPGLTRIETWRRLVEMIRSEIGDAVAVGCGIPLWASVGLVDAARIGSDVGVEWRGHLSAESLLRDQAARNFANQILWQADPDCILMRERFHHLTESELRSLALYAGMAGGVVMTSDALENISSERLRLWKLIVTGGEGPCRYPFLGQSSIHYTGLPADDRSHRVRHEPASDPVQVQVRGDAGSAAVFVFNTGESPVQRSYLLSALGLQGSRYVFDWTSNCGFKEPLDRISVTLKAHDGALLFFGPSPIADAPESLP